MTAQIDDMRMAVARNFMVQSQIEARGVSDPRVLEAVRRVPRHRFVPASYLLQAHEDHPLPLGHGQTISQPYIVAYMAEELGLRGHERVLEVGSGCGYMAAVLSLLVKDVYGI
jgi:protein-L-isoaspartate(D-aspartate) O-methyltransferase